MRLTNPLLDAWESHREVPFRLSEIFTRAGRLRHLARWRAFRAARARAAATELGVRWPPGWADNEICRTYDVFAEHCYDVPGFIPEGGLVVDAGMAVGDFAVLSARRGSRVVAFEPLPENVALATSLAMTNGVADRIVVRPVALGDRSGSSTVEVEAGMATAVGNRSGRPLPFERLDAALRDVPDRVSLLKIDVEGFEVPLLRGGTETIRRSRPRIILEVHGKAADREVAAILTSLGYGRVSAGPKRLSSAFGFARNDFWAPTGEVATPAVGATSPGRYREPPAPPSPVG